MKKKRLTMRTASGRQALESKPRSHKEALKMARLAYPNESSTRVRMRIMAHQVCPDDSYSQHEARVDEALRILELPVGSPGCVFDDDDEKRAIRLTPEARALFQASDALGMPITARARTPASPEASPA